MPSADQLQFSDRVAVITGAARGLGREYALLLASRGAAVVVNDLGGGRDGSGKSDAADAVVQEIVQSGGRAVADYNSVEEGHKIVQTAIDHFGRIDILINNAGILRDKSLLKMTDEDWDLVHRVHLRGAFLTTRAAWPHFKNQNYGRVVMTSSPSGIYGNFGQANYGSAKLGLLSLAKTLAIEGAKYNIKCNTIVPVAASRLTEDVLPDEMKEKFKPKYVAPMVAFLSHESCPVSGEAFEAAAGFYGQYRWQRSKGKVFMQPDAVTVEDISNSWSELTNMTEYSSPTSMQDHTFKLISQLVPEDEAETGEEASPQLREESTKPADHLVSTYSAQDVILYALSVGVSTLEPQHLSFLYEGDDNFAVLPTFAASFSLNAVYETSLFQEAIAKYNLEDNLIRTLHGEQYLKVYQPIPTSGKLVSKPKIIDVLDKGSGALILIEVPTYDQRGELIFYNQLSLFMLGSGNFGGKRTSDNSTVVAGVEVPSRAPDAIVCQQTTPEQAATFRLCGDRNPLHIDPGFSIIGGFDRPILHGLCMLGFAVRHALRQFADYDAALFDATKARFVGTIIPGQTIETRLWRAANGDLTRIHFECFVKETGSQLISSAFVDLKLPPPADIAPSRPDSVRLSPPSPHSATTDTVPSPMAPLSLNSHNETVQQCKIDAIFEDNKLRDKIRQNPQVIQHVNTVYQLNINKDGKPFSVWTLDLKNGTGDIYRGTIEKGKPGCTLTVDDDIIADIFQGKADALQAFMSGQLKVTGNILAAQKLQQVFAENLLKKSDQPDEADDKNVDDEADKALLDSVPISGLKSDLVFTLLRNRMHEEPDFIRRIRASYQFNITLNGKYAATWTAENKTEVNGCCYSGPYKNGKADCIVTVDDEDFTKLMFGKLNPQRAFMLGKLKVKGNIMLLQKLNSLWLELLKSGKAPEFPYIMELMSKTDLIPGLRSEVMVIELVQRLIRLPYLCTEVASLIGFEVIKDGKVAAQYTLDFTKNKETGVFNRGLPQGAQHCVLTMTDEDFTRLTNHKFTLEQGIEAGKIKVRGDQSVPAKISIIFKTPTSRVKL